MGRHRHGDGHDGHRADGAAAVAADAAPRSTTGVGARLQPRGGRRADRRDRRRDAQSLALFLVGLFVFGNGQAANLLARYAATDLAEPDERSRAMSRIVFASTFGAVLGPLMIGPTEHAAEAWFGLDRYTGPWLFSAPPSSSPRR